MSSGIVDPEDLKETQESDLDMLVQCYQMHSSFQRPEIPGKERFMLL